MKQFAYTLLAFSHALLSIILQSLSAWKPDAMLHVTARTQYADWATLIDAFQGPSAAATLLDDARTRSWCADLLPAGTSRPPFCSCVETQARVAALLDPQDARGLVTACLHLRPPWRIWSIWSVQLATPTVYLLASGCIFYILGMSPAASWHWPTLYIGAVTVVLFMTQHVMNLTWIFGLFFLLLMIFLFMKPVLVLVPPIDTATVCFWWAEACAAPVYALYFLLLCTRDVVFVTAGVTIAAGIATMSIRSFWYTHMFRDKNKTLVWRVRFYVWLCGVLGTAFFACLLPPPSFSPLLSGSAATFAMVVTLGIALSQIPGVNPSRLLPFQLAVGGIRNVVFAVFMAIDLTSSDLL